MNVLHADDLASLTQPSAENDISPACLREIQVEAG
jgi:hypothetical protein